MEENQRIEKFWFLQMIIELLFKQRELREIFFFFFFFLERNKMEENERKRILAFCIYRIIERKGRQGRVLRKTVFCRKEKS